MTRTESTTRRVDPDYEQVTIDLMQRFHWNLVNSQNVKNQTSHLERDGDNLVQVKETEHFVNLVFSRPLDTPNLARLRELEAEYYSLKKKARPGLGAPIGLGALFSFMVVFAFAEKDVVNGLISMSLAACCFPWYKRNVRKRLEVDEWNANIQAQEVEILNECERL